LYLTQTEGDVRYAPLGESPGSGARYLFDVSTAIGSIGTGEIRFNNTVSASITSIAIYETDRNGGAMATFLDLISVGSKLQVSFDASEEIYAWFNVTAIVDNGAFRTFTVTHIASAGTRANGEVTLGIFGSAGSSLTVRDVDGTPSIAASVIEFPNGSLTDQGGGVARLTLASGGASGIQYTYNDADPPTASGQIRTLQASLNVATAVAINAADVNGDSATDITARLKTGAIFTIAKDASNYVRFEATADYASGSVAVIVRAEHGTILTGDTVFLAIASNAPSTGSGGAGSAQLASGIISGTSTSSVITITSTAAASGGVAPYTYAWHKGTASGFAINSGSLIAGAMSAGYTDSGLPASTGFYYRRIVTDGLGNKVATDELFVSTIAAVGAVVDTFTRTGALVGSNVETPSTGVTYGTYLTSGSSGSIVSGNAQGVASFGTCVRLLGVSLGGTYTINATITPSRYIAIIARASSSATQTEGIWASFIPGSNTIRIESTNASFVRTTLVTTSATLSGSSIAVQVNVTPTSVQLLVPSLSVNITATTALYSSNNTAGLYFDAVVSTPDIVSAWDVA
jgi:hypothetical protein